MVCSRLWQGGNRDMTIICGADEAGRLFKFVLTGQEDPS